MSLIKLKNVHKSYYLSNGEEIPVLRGVDLEIKKNEFVAIMGESGGGKSTFINMILRFYDPDDGAVFVNGTNIKDLTQESLKHHISLVSQRIYIFQNP